ncbi:MAG TPA: hypothetical protein VEJ45_10355 [Candidatus Acidoferrales bacterium]|nr:hypothetical protein [Candidatus Acidoferrales bacterium]
MRKIAGAMCLLATLAISLLAVPLDADESAAPKRTVIASKYDVSKEVTIEGTVQALVTKPTPGMMVGAHLVVSTPQGTVYAHIGNRVITGPSAASFASGQAVKLVGVVTELNQQKVILVRTIETENRTITVRNEHGFLVSPSVSETTGGGR